jgi:periplasmic protein TonB
MVSQPLPIATLHPGGSRKPKRSEQPPVPQPAEDIFTKALLELPTEYKHRNPLEWVFSLLVHAAVIASLIILPLYFTQAIDLQAFQTNWLVAPVPPGPPPPPAPAAAVRVMKSVARLMQGGKMMAPSVIPKKIAIIKEDALPPDTTDGVVGGVPGGIPGGQVGGVLAGIIGGSGNSVSVVAPPPPVKRIVRVGGDLKPPRRIYAIDPEYPFIAKQAKVQGTVVIDAVIDEQGNVVQAHVVSGPGLLLASALEAVGKWKYEPTRLNGQPISVEMHVEVHFVLE